MNLSDHLCRHTGLIIYKIENKRKQMQKNKFYDHFYQLHGVTIKYVKTRK